MAVSYAMAVKEPRIFAVALVTETELELLGQGFDRAYRVDETPCFGELLAAIDDADREMRLNMPTRPAN